MGAKFTSKGIAHCTKCRGVVIKDFKVVDGLISFVSRCPHCEEGVSIEIDRGGEMTVKPISRMPESGS